MKKIKKASRALVPPLLIFTLIFSSGIMMALTDRVGAERESCEIGVQAIRSGSTHNDIMTISIGSRFSEEIGDWKVEIESEEDIIITGISPLSGGDSGKYRIFIDSESYEFPNSSDEERDKITIIYFGTECGLLDNGNDENENGDTVTIKAYKVVCDDESYLPKWGGSPGFPKGDRIDGDTAQNFVDYANDEAEREVCWLEEGWEFEWGLSDVSTSDPGRDYTGDAGTGWTTFGPTDENGFAQTTISEEDFTNQITGNIGMREVLQEGYIPFTYPSGSNSPPSAEFYCHEDVWHYNNFEWIEDPVLGETYYCVGFNAPKTTNVEVCKEDEEGSKLYDWEVTLSYKKSDLEFTKTTEDHEEGEGHGCVIFEDVPYGEYELSETLKEGWEHVEGAGDVTIDGDTESFTIVNREKKEVTINAYKVICEDESDLPNWAREENYPYESGNPLTKQDIIDYVEAREGCEFAEGWDFEWNEPDTDLIPGNHYGWSYDYDSDNAWNSFDTSTDKSGKATVTIPYHEERSHFWIREVLKQGYLPFSDSDDGTYSVSAELICHIDGWKYDNYDRVDNPEDGGEYICVAFNVPVVTIKAQKVVCADESDLPNWVTHENDPYYSGNFLTKQDIKDYVNDEENNCWFEEGWEFEWGYDGEAETQDGALTGKAGIGKGWHDFDSATGGECSPAIATIMDLTPSNRIWVREVLQDGYLPFAYPNPGWDGTDNMVSAELICHTDGWKYDNYDYVDNAEKGNYYYCVAFNVSEEEKECEDIVVVSNEENKVYEVENFKNGFLGKIGNAVKTFVHKLWTSITGAEWIWKTEYVENPTQEEIYGFKKEFDVHGTVSSATLQMAADNSYKVWVNECLVGEDDGEHNYADIEEYPVDSSCFKETGNIIKFKVRNLAGASDPEDNPAGLLYRLDIERDTCYIPEELACDPTFNLIENGSFEDPVVEDNSSNWELYDTIPGWTLVEGDYIELQRYAFDSADGKQHLELDSDGGNPASAIEQEIDTIPGESYQLKFAWSPRPESQADDSEVNMEVRSEDDTSLLSATIVSGSGAIDWQYETYYFTAEESKTIIKFSHGGTPNTYGGLVDDVQVYCGVDPDPKGTITAYKHEYKNELELYNLSQTLRDGWTITIEGEGISDDCITGEDGDGMCIFSELPEGSYTVCEVMKDGWEFEYSITGSWMLVTDYVAEENDLNSLCVEIDIENEDAKFVYFYNKKTTPSLDPVAEASPMAGGGPIRFPDPRGEVAGVEDEREVEEDEVEDPEEEVLGEEDEVICGVYLHDHLRYGRANNPNEVKKLQLFLNTYMGEDLPISGMFGAMTKQAVQRFQERHANEVLTPWGLEAPTGYVYLTTKRWINMIVCPELNLPMPTLIPDTTGAVGVVDPGMAVAGEEDVRAEDPEEIVDEEDREVDEEEMVDEEVAVDVDEEEEREDDGRTAIAVIVIGLVMLGFTLYYVFNPIK